MLTTYIVCAILGGGLMLAGAFIGHGDDMDADLSPDHDHDISHESPIWIPFFSMRFWTYAVGTFGMLGLFLTWLKLAGEPLRAIIAAITGVALGLTVSLISRALKKSQELGALQPELLVGKEVKAIVGSDGTNPGKVRLPVRAELIDFLAVSADGQSFKPGDTLVITELEGNNVKVLNPNQALES